MPVDVSGYLFLDCLPLILLVEAVTHTMQYRAAFLGVKYAATKMQSLGKGGSIIITASLASEAAYPELCAYNMSKFAVRALAVTAAQEYAKDRIRVNAVSPGFVATPLIHAWDNLEARLKATPAGKHESHFSPFGSLYATRIRDLDIDHRKPR
jgi:NAD(P)-dependent dehydrogenase (short-subunit alcohol dehydrogenase family)